MRLLREAHLGCVKGPWTLEEAVPTHTMGLAVGPSAIGGSRLSCWCGGARLLMEAGCVEVTQEMRRRCGEGPRIALSSVLSWVPGWSLTTDRI